MTMRMPPMSRKSVRLALFTILTAGLIGSLYLHAEPPRAEPPKVATTEKKVIGSWSIISTNQEKDDAEIVWTFRADGTCRVDAIDRKSREHVRNGHGMMGRWQLKNDDLIFQWDV